MDFELTDDQVALQEGVRAFCQGRFPIEVVRANEEAGGVIDRGRWRELGEMGIFSLRLDGFGVADAVLAFEELGSALVPGPLVETLLAATHLPSVAGASDGSVVVGATWRSEPIVAIEHPGDLDVVLVVATRRPPPGPAGGPRIGERRTAARPAGAGVVLAGGAAGG